VNVIAIRGETPDFSRASQPANPRPKRWWQRRWFKVLAICVLLGLIAAFAIAEYVIHNAEPIIRKRVIETLSDKFDAPVQLDELHISLVRGVEVQGGGLRIPYGSDTAGRPDAPNKPLISVKAFNFHTTFRGLLRQPTSIGKVTMVDAEVHIPPPGQRPALLGTNEGKQPVYPLHPRWHPKLSFRLGEVDCADMKLFIESSNPEKDPLEFDIQNMQLRNVSPKLTMDYTARLVNPKPVGDIVASGHAGPWNVPDPRDTPIDGDYSFTHADLNTIKGIGGILSSTGHFGGQLGELTVDGETDTPNFSVDTGNHPVPLHTKFHAIVDGTSGDTYLQPVQAHLLHSNFTAVGKIVRVKGKGHDIQLDVTMPNARMEDMLLLAVKTNPPLMRGALHMKTKLHIPPGKDRVMAKLDMQGKFSLDQVSFSNMNVQNKVDGMSMRAQGRPKEVAEAANDHTIQARSQMNASFTLTHSLIKVDDLHYEMPGAHVQMNGVYSADGNIFEFKGHVRTDATASQMVTGWKSWLLKPVDPFLKKNGAGLQLPIAISGTQGDVHFGLAMHGTADQTSTEIASDLRDKRQGLLNDAKSKREREKAKREQEKANGESGKKQEKADRKAQKELEGAERHQAAADAAKASQ
jgi:hypothetical protein